MNFTEGKTIFARQQRLITLHTLKLDVDETLIAEAEQELLQRRQERREEGFVWGYLLGVEFGEEKEFPKAQLLIREVLRQLGREKETRDFQFSFCKACKGRSASDAEGVHYEGMHLDTHPDITDEKELLRLLFNFFPRRRQFHFAHADRRSLQQQGLELDRKFYKTLELPGNVRTQVIDIPGREGNTVHFLRFWASVVPHVGITEEEGYFLVSFETLREFNLSP